MIKYIKSHYKRIQRVFSIILSVLLILSFPLTVSAADEQVIKGTDLWFTNCSLNSNVSAESLGNVNYYIQKSNSKYYTGDKPSEYVHTGMWAQYIGYDVIPWNGMCYVATILLPESISIKKEQSYSIEIPLVYIFGDSETQYALETNLLRISLWDNTGTYGNGTFDFFSSDKVKWSPTYYDPMEDTTTGQMRTQNKVKIELSNYSNKNYNINYILVAFRISNGVNLYPTSGFGIYDDIVVTNNGKVYPKMDTSSIEGYIKAENAVADITEPGLNKVSEFFSSFSIAEGNIGKGLLAWTEIFEEFIGEVPIFSELAVFSIMLGLFGFILGLVIIVSRHVRPSDYKGFTLSEDGYRSDAWSREHL